MCYGPRRPPETGRRLATAACLLLSACVGSIDSPRSWTEAEAKLNGTPVLNPDGTPVEGSVLNGAPGATGNGPTSGPSASGNGKTNGGGAGACNVGSSPMRRLTHTEYNNAVQDLLGDATAPATTFVHDNLVGLFDNTAEAQTVPSLLGDQYMDAALELANNVKDFRGLMGCDPQATGATGESCIKNFITSFGRRAYRRTLTTTSAKGLGGPP
jgi:hypothetical protein